MLFFRAHDRKSFFLQGDLLSSEILGTDSAPDVNTENSGSPQAQESLHH